MTTSYAPTNLGEYESAPLADDSPVRAKPIWTTVVFVAGLAMVNTYFLTSTHQPVSDYALFLASAAFWVLALPPWLFFVRSRRRTFPFLVFSSAAFAIYFVLPVFSSSPLFFYYQRAEWTTVDRSLELALGGAIAMMVGALGTRRFFVGAPRIRQEIDLTRAIPFLIAGSAISFVLRIAMSGTAQATFGSIFYGINACGEIALGALVLAWLRGRLNPAHKIYTAGLMGVLIVIGIATGMLSNVAMPLVGLAFVYGWERRTLPWGAMLGVILILFPLNATKAQFRAVHWNSTADNFSAGNIGFLFSSFVSMTVDAVESGELANDDMAQNNESRTNMLGMLAIVVADTPQYVPYWAGYTYSDLVWHLIPRVLVPGLPSPPIGQDFPRRYEFIDYNNYNTSVNLPQFVEFYINFGPIGVIVGMFVIGLIYSFLDHLFSASSGGAVIGGIVLSGLMNMESNFSLVFGGIPLMALGYYAFIRMLPMERAPALVPVGKTA